MITDRRQALRFFAAGALSVGVTRGLGAIEPHVVVPAYNTLSDEQEIQLGRHFANTLEQETPIISNGLIERYLGGIVARLAQASQRPNLPYSIKVINSREVNAFSLAGGFLYVNRGLVEFINREDELVAAIAHEIGHVVGRHATNRILRSFAARRVLASVISNLGLNNGIVERIIASFGGALAMITLLHFSRQDETEADLLGFYEMLRAGWNPDGLLHLFERLAAIERQNPSVLGSYLSSHPSSVARAQVIEHELAEVTVPSGAREDTISFAAFRLAIKLLPEPPRHDTVPSPR